MRPVLAWFATFLISFSVFADDDVNVIIELAEVRPASSKRDVRGDLARITRRAALRHEYRDAFNGVSARVPKSSLEAIARLPYVKKVHPDRTVEALIATSVPIVGAPQVWERLGARGKGVVVAIVDSGIDYRHYTLGGGLGPGFKVAGGYDFADLDDDPMDEFGHGTHVAGVLAGDTAPLIGVAPQATLLAYKVLGKDGRGLDSSIIAAIDRGIDPNGDGDRSDRVDVMNLSLGRLTWGDADPLVQAVERAVAAGIVVVVAAGNSGGPFEIHTPAIAPSVITVGSTDMKDAVASFTSRGPVPGTWAFKPDVAAPGQGVLSAKVGGNRTVGTGTSVSAPHVAGVAALIRELHPTWTPEEVKSAIVSTAKPLFTNEKLRAIGAGGGRVDAPRAVEATILPSPSVVAFGIPDPSIPQWQASRTVRVVNRGTATETLNLSLTGIPSGATLTVSPQSMTLAPDASAEFTVSISVDTKTALTPTDESIAVSGNIEIAGATTSVHVPWTVMAGYQVAVAYKGSDPYELHVATPQRHTAAFIEERHTLSSVVQPGPVDVVVLTYPENGGRPRAIVREQVPVQGFTYITIDPSAATLELEVAGVDESGARLSSYPQRRITHEFVLASGRVVEWWPRTSPLVSPLQVTGVRTWEMAARRGTAYFAMHRRLNGLQQNETLTFPTSDWSRQPVQMECAAECEFAGTIGFGTRVGFIMRLLTSTAYTGTFWVTPPREEGYNFRAYAMTRRPGQGEAVQRKSWLMLSPGMRADRDRVTLRASDTAWPVDYTPPQTGSVVGFGDGPGLMRTQMGPRSATEWSVSAVPVGSLGEDLAETAPRLTASMTNSAGTAVKWQQVFVAGTFVTTAALPADVYSLRLINENHLVNGARARGTLTSTFDTRVHPAAPTLTSLRVEDGLRSAASTIRAGDNARLLFSARQTTSNLGTVTHAPVVDSATKAWWRPSGATEWQSLPVSFVGSQYGTATTNGPAGSVFAADLGPMSRAVAGNVDLRVEVTNEHGGTTEWVLEPALAVIKSAAGKRRAVR